VPDAPVPDAPVREIFLAHTEKQDSASVPVAAMAAEFKRQVESLSAGRIKVGIFPAGQLGGNREITRLVGRNVVQSCFATVGGVAPAYPALAVTQIPFAAKSEAAAQAAYDGAFGRLLAEGIERRTGMMVLGYGDGGGMAVLTNSRRPVREPEDLHGLKIRVIPGFKPQEVMVRALGAVPVAISSREELSALAAGVADGQMNTPQVILANRFDEVQKHLTLTEHLYAPLLWLFNRQNFDGLDADGQRAVRQAATSALALGRRLAAEVQASERGMPALLRRLKVLRLSAGQRESFRRLAQGPVIAQVAAGLDGEGRLLMESFLRGQG
jgi:TRAP-type transport system periplasmic protein